MVDGRGGIAIVSSVGVEVAGRGLGQRGEGEEKKLKCIICAQVHRYTFISNHWIAMVRDAP